MQNRKDYDKLAMHLTTIVRHSAEVTTMAIDAEKMARKLADSRQPDAGSSLTRVLLAGKLSDLQQSFARQVEEDRQLLKQLASRVFQGKTNS